MMSHLFVGSESVDQAVSQHFASRVIPDEFRIAHTFFDQQLYCHLRPELRIESVLGKT